MAKKEPKTKTKTFHVGAHLKLWVDVEVEAASFDEAVAMSKTFAVEDFVSFEGTYNDGSMKVIQVYDPNFCTEAD